MARRAKARSARATACAAASIALVAVAWEPEARAEPLRLTLGAGNEAEAWTSNVVATTRLALHGFDTVMGPLERQRPTGAAETLGRIATFITFELPILSYALVIPHELFGHGARYREFGGDVTVSLDAPFPYSFEARHSVTARLGRSLFTGEQILAELGGLHAQERAIHGVAFGAVRTGYFRRSDALVYSLFALTHGAQVLFGGDLRQASSLAAREYGGDAEGYRTAQRAALVADTIDPYLWIAMFGALVRYGARGERAFRAPSLGVLGFDASLRTHSFAYPWGPGYVVHVLAKRPEVSLDVSVDVGVGPQRSSFATNVHAADVHLGGPLFLGLEAALWVEPPVSSAASSADEGRRAQAGAVGFPRGDGKGPSFVGGAGRLTFEARVGHLLVGTRLGWKSLGIWGERPIAAGGDVALTVGWDLAPPTLGGI